MGKRNTSNLKEGLMQSAESLKQGVNNDILLGNMLDSINSADNTDNTPNNPSQRPANTSEHKTETPNAKTSPSPTPTKLKCVQAKISTELYTRIINLKAQNSAIGIHPSTIDQIVEEALTKYLIP